MTKLEKILEDWKNESSFGNDLENATLNTAILHAKYIEMLAHEKLIKKKLEQEFDILLKNKWLWYNGKMTKEQMDALGWSYEDPLSGLKILKGEMEHYYKSDKDIIAHEAKIELAITTISTLEEIINTLRWRHSAIKNIIEIRKFEAGV